MPNHLADETSPYLLQHANNPVDWYAWGEEALARAKSENKPIFLSIGYAACHWCHVMAHESFEKADVAAFLNQNFISIKVDREERPDIDSIYMSAVVAMTGQGGWPLSVFLTPAGKPFYGGTYFPPTGRYGLPGFMELLAGIVDTWKNRTGEIDRAASSLIGAMQQELTWQVKGSASAFSLADLQPATQKLVDSFDRDYGGWGSAPKFPQPMAVEFLLRQSARGDQAALATAVAALKAMNLGGIYDVVGGGFHRYSTSRDWLVPHFEKMLYDNAQLALAYLHAYLVTHDQDFRRTCEETLDFILRELTGPEGGFYSSLDADSEGEEGKFYLWDKKELRELLSFEDFLLVEQVYSIPNTGNFQGKIILKQSQELETTCKELDLDFDAVQSQLTSIHRRLLETRGQRPRPATDDKVLVSWNCLALQAFSEAARSLDRPDYLEAAQLNAAFLTTALFPDGRLKHTWRAGQTHQPAFLEDYAGLILGLLSLYQAGQDNRWFSMAATLTRQMVEQFKDEAGGFFNTSREQDALIIRPKDLQDNAIPSGNALACMALLQMAAFTGATEWVDLALQPFAALQETMVKYPTAFAYWLQALDFSLGPTRQIALLWPAGDQAHQDFLGFLWKQYLPGALLAASSYPPAENAPELLRNRPLSGNKTTVFVCQGFVCKLPVTSLADLAEQLSR
jgi:uncharacterized protein